MIAEGRIALNGETLTTPATILTSLDGVTVDGNPVDAPTAARLFLFHKPTGVLTAERDPAGRPTIYDRLSKDLPRLVPVGRLDLNTEGLLLMTTDGELKRQLELPSTGVERSYRARAYGPITQEQLESLMEGIEIEGVRYGSIDANLERRTGTNTWIQMRLKEGKNREVRRVLEHFGLKVSRLIRTSYGPFALEDMPPGAVVEVPQHELVAFRKALDKPGGLPEAGEWTRPSTPIAPKQPGPKRPANASRRGAGRTTPAGEAPKIIRSSGRIEGGRPVRPDRARPADDRAGSDRNAAPQRDRTARTGPRMGTGKPAPRRTGETPAAQIEERKARPKPKAGWAKPKHKRPGAKPDPRGGKPRGGKPPARGGKD